MDEKPSTAVEKDEYAAPVAASEKELDEEKTEIVTGGESTDSAGSTSGRLPRDHTVTLNHKMVYNQIINRKVRTEMVPMLIMVAGIPPGSAGDKNVLEKFFRTIKLSEALSLKTLGITSYDLIALQDDESKPLYKTITPSTCYLTAAYSAVMRKYRLISDRKKFSTYDESQSLFANDLDLDKSLHNLYEGLENANTGKTLDNDLKRFLPKGFAAVNIWNVASSKSTFYFLPFLSNQLRNNYFWLLFNHECNAENLLLPPTFSKDHHDKELLMLWRSQLYYLLRNVYYSSGIRKAMEKRCSLFCSSPTLQSETIREIISKLAEEMKIPHLIHHEDIIELSVPKLKEAADSIVAEGFRSNKENIRLSWIFLRKHFYESDELYISKDKLMEKASNLMMSEKNFNKFCRFFSSFGSIIDASKLGSQSHYIILKPVEFFSSLDRLLYHDAELVCTYGLLTLSVLKQVFPKHAELFINVLLSANLATTINRDNVIVKNKETELDDLEPSQKLYFIPIASKMPSLKECKHSELHLRISGHVLCRNIQATFTEKFLEKHKSFKIVFETNSDAVFSNCTSYVYNVWRFDMICHGNEVEFLIDETAQSEIDLYFAILDCCYSMVEHFIRKEVNFKLDFSFLCCNELSKSPFLHDKVRHNLPMGPDSCEHPHCKTLLSSPPLKMWNKVLTKDLLKWEALPTFGDEQGSLSSDTVTRIATLLKELSPASFDALAKSLEFHDNTSKSIIKRYTGWKRILVMILEWENKYNHREGETVFKLKNKLSRLRNDCDMKDKRIIDEALKLHLSSPPLKIWNEELDRDISKFEDLPAFVDEQDIQSSKKVNEQIKKVKGKMKVTRFVLHGAPQSGKSSVRDLLADKPPVEKESTRLAEDPVQAVCTNPISTIRYTKTDQSLLEELKEDELIRMVQREVQNEANKEVNKKLYTAEQKSTTEKEEQGEVQTVAAMKPSESQSTVKTKPKVAVQGNTMQNVATNMSTAECAPKPTVNPSLITSVPSSSSQSTQNSSDELPHCEVLRDIATKLDSLDPNVTPFFNCHHLNIVDSGGQPEFSNLLPLVCESESHNHAVVIRLDKKLHDYSPNCININGKVYNLPQRLMLTDYQLIERVLQLVAGSKSRVIIIGTHLDQENKDEPLHIKYKLLEPLMKKYESNLLLNDGKPIFAVNAMAPVGKERTTYARTLQDVILNPHHEDQEEGGIEVQLSWIVFELELNRRSKSRGIIGINEVSEVAKVLKVKDSSEVLKFFNKLGVLYHYPNSLPDIVFTSISPISLQLSDIVEASFDLKYTPKTADHKKLQTTGKLSSKFLKALCSKAKSNDLFTVNEFISLLNYFRILFQIDQNTFLIPSLLPIDPKHNQCIDYSQYHEPLVCFWKHNDDLRILPQSYYHALIVELLSNKEKCTFALTQVHQCRLIFYFDAVFQISLGFQKRRVVLIDHTFWLEMLVNCNTPREQCLQLLDIIQLCTTRVLLLLDLMNLGKLKCGLLCYSDKCRADCTDPQRANPHPCECTVPEEFLFECVIKKDILPVSLEKKRLFWFKDDVEKVDQTILQPNRETIISVVEATADVFDWDFLASLLGISEVDLKCIQSDHKESLRQRNKAIITKWLDSGNASWAALVSALRHDLVGKGAVADNIAEKHLKRNPLRK